VKGQPITAGYLSDAQRGGELEVEILPGEEAPQLRRWLQGEMRKLGVEVLISDDADAVKEVADRLELEQQLCVAHVRTLRLWQNWQRLT
jgi:DNA-binding GntR family transcriptional regulator